MGGRRGTHRQNDKIRWPDFLAALHLLESAAGAHRDLPMTRTARRPLTIVRARNQSTGGEASGVASA